MMIRRVSSSGGESALSALISFFFFVVVVVSAQGPGPKPPVFPSVCVKIAMYDNTRCGGSPKQVVKYPTFKEPGHSPCFSNPAKALSSIGDQYCDLTGQVYHMDFYPFNPKCEGPPLKLKIPTDNGCVLGIKVYNCKEKPCFMSEEEQQPAAAEANAVEELFLEDLVEELQQVMHDNLEQEQQ